MVLGFVLNIAIIRLGVLCILFISALLYKSSCQRIGLFTIFLRWWEDLDSCSREDLDSWGYPIPAHVPFQIFQKANTWKSNQIKEPQNDKWNNRQCFELLLHMLNKCTRKKKKTETRGKADPHVIKLSWANQEKWKRLEMIRLW